MTIATDYVLTSNMCKCNVASAVNVFAAQESRMSGLLQNIVPVTGEDEQAELKDTFRAAFKNWSRMRMCTYLV